MNPLLVEGKPLRVGQKVLIDGDMQAIVSGICYRMEEVLVEIKYFSNGDQKEIWVESWRLSLP